MNDADVVTFYNPHPGMAGAIRFLPPSVLHAIKDLNSKTMSLKEAVAIIKAATKDLKFCKIEVRCSETSSVGDPYISLHLFEGDPYPQHCFRLISYKRK